MKKSTVFCLFLTLLVLAAAFLLPGAWIQYGQQALEAQSFVQPAVSLSQDPASHSILHSLQLLSDDSLGAFELEEQVDPQQIQRQLMKQLKILKDLGIAIPFLPDPEEQEIPVQTVAKTLRLGQDHAVYLYRIGIAQGFVWMDVQSGKIVQISLRVEADPDTEQTFLNWRSRWEETEASASQALHAWAAYYELLPSPSVLKPFSLEGTDFPWNDCLFLGLLQEESEPQVGLLGSCWNVSPDSDTILFSVEPISVEELEQIQQELKK